MVVREQDVRDALDPEPADVVEHVAVAEVDEHRLRSRAKDVDVARVAEQRHAGRHRSQLGLHAHGREYAARSAIHTRRIRVRLRRRWEKSSSTTSSRSSREAYARSTTST
jgi:hypothetical protein